MVSADARRRASVSAAAGSAPAATAERATAWGLADSDGRSHVFGVDGRTRMTLGSPERAVRHFSGRPDITARLIRLAQPEAATAAAA